MIPNSKIVAVASGKGGVGKTWFAITLCHTLAQAGKRVLLFDGDLGLANIDIQLGLTPIHDLGEVIEGKITLSKAITEFRAGGFDVIAGRSGSGTLATMPTQQVAMLRQGITELATNYDCIIIDLGAGVDRPVRMMSEIAQKSFIVINDEPTSLTDAYAFIKLSKTTNAEADLRIVVNNAQNAQDGAKTYETIKKACENFLKYKPPLAGVVRKDNRVRDAIRAQMPLLTRSPQSEAAQDVSKIMQDNF